MELGERDVNENISEVCGVPEGSPEDVISCKTSF